jgi:hypothetical protein
MRACTCVWGGIYNPIIPVFRTAPHEWKPDRFERVKGLSVAKGYINFFEPDVFVEAEEGLLESAGLQALREKHSLGTRVTILSHFLTPSDGRDWSEPAFGLPIIDVLQHLHQTEQRFQLKEQRRAVSIQPLRETGLVEAVFGAYPAQPDTSYIAKGYADVFAPEQLEANPASWLETFKMGAQTPLRLTRDRTEALRYWHHDLVVYVFDPARATDLIDLWNLRLEPRPILPVPMAWCEELADHIRNLVRNEHRPVRGNPSGIMHHVTLEIARSIRKDQADSIIAVLNKDLPEGALHIKLWRNGIWAEHSDARIHRDRRMEITAEERRASLTVKEERERTISFDTLHPEFASRYGGHAHRWVNAIKITAFGTGNVATVLPFNTFDRYWPRLALTGGRVVVGTEGWIFSERYRLSSETISPLSKEDAIIGSLKRLGVEAELSDPGHIAKQMLEHLGGLWGTHLLADVETIQILNKMAGGLRRKNNEADTVEETFERRTASAKDWADLIARRLQRASFTPPNLGDFTERNIIRLGLETDCPHCQATNWHSLTATDYNLTCERCLNHYRFPQADLRRANANWRYRVVGPFSVPDYGRGAYGALLTLRLLGDSSHEMTFSTAMSLKFDGVDTEVDFVAWRRRERHDTHDSPDLILGEAKSLGQATLLRPKDIVKLKAVGAKLPSSTIIVSVLRDEFTSPEKKLLRSLAVWGRRPAANGRATNPVVLLTGRELFGDQWISQTWKNLGPPYDKYADGIELTDLHALADATQRIHLDLPSIHEQWDRKWKRRARRNKS